jgi:hypothetical protein
VGADLSPLAQENFAEPQTAAAFDLTMRPWRTICSLPILPARPFLRWPLGLFPTPAAALLTVSAHLHASLGVQTPVQA